MHPDIFPDNKTTSYRVKLPHTINLNGEWEVGLYSISYPNTWYTLRDINRDIAYLLQRQKWVLFHGKGGLWLL